MRFRPWLGVAAVSAFLYTPSPRPADAAHPARFGACAPDSRALYDSMRVAGWRFGDNQGLSADTVQGVVLYTGADGMLRSPDEMDARAGVSFGDTAYVLGQAHDAHGRCIPGDFSVWKKAGPPPVPAMQYRSAASHPAPWRARPHR